MNIKKITLMMIFSIIITLPLIGVKADAVKPMTDVPVETEYSYYGMTEEKASLILHAIYGSSLERDEPHYAPCGNIFCIFGHSIATGAVIVVDHNVYSTSPRCLQTITHVEYCTRDGCSYFKVTDEYVQRIVCH